MNTLKTEFVIDGIPTFNLQHDAFRAARRDDKYMVGLRIHTAPAVIGAWMTVPADFDLRGWIAQAHHAAVDQRNNAEYRVRVDGIRVTEVREPGYTTEWIPAIHWIRSHGKQAGLVIGTDGAIVPAAEGFAPKRLAE